MFDGLFEGLRACLMVFRQTIVRENEFTHIMFEEQFDYLGTMFNIQPDLTTVVDPPCLMSVASLNLMKTLHKICTHTFLKM